MSDLLLKDCNEERIYKLFEDFDEDVLIRYRTVIDSILGSKQGSFS